MRAYHYITYYHIKENVFESQKRSSLCPAKPKARNLSPPATGAEFSFPRLCYQIKSLSLFTCVWNSATFPSNPIHWTLFQMSSILRFRVSEIVQSSKFPSINDFRGFPESSGFWFVLNCILIGFLLAQSTCVRNPNFCSPHDSSHQICLFVNVLCISRVL